jgi:hypothetical protein
LIRMITSAQIRAARAILRWTPLQLAAQSKVPIEAIRRAEQVDGEAPLTVADESAIRLAFGAADVEFTSGDAPGVSLRMKPGRRDEGLRPDQLTSENDG